MADPLAARQQAVGELLRLQVRVARDVLEPLGGVACGGLQLQHFDAPFGFVGGRAQLECRGPAWSMRLGQTDGILQRELRAGADGEMRGMGCVAHQHDIVHRPVFVGDAVEVDELRAAQMTHVGQQRVAVEPGRKKPLAEADRFSHVHPVEARGSPGCVACLHDERRGIGVEAIGVGLEPAEFGFDEDEGECIEQLVRAEPGESVVADLDRWLEVIGVRAYGSRC